jgi:hypothetical protein
MGGLELATQVVGVEAAELCVHAGGERMQLRTPLVNDPVKGVTDLTDAEKGYYEEDGPYGCKSAEKQMEPIQVKRQVPEACIETTQPPK